MVPDRTSSRVFVAALVMVALTGASGCAHRRISDLRISSPPGRAVPPGIERLERRRAVEKGVAKTSGSRETSAAGMAEMMTDNAAPASASGATSFGTSVVMTPQPAPAADESAARAAEHARPSDAMSSRYPLVGTILVVVLLVAAWAVARALSTRRVPS
jgi:cobalamin biosynthesis Mg chelatase CobN